MGCRRRLPGEEEGRDRAPRKRSVVLPPRGAAEQGIAPKGIPELEHPRRAAPPAGRPSQRDGRESDPRDCEGRHSRSEDRRLLEEGTGRGSRGPAVKGQRRAISRDLSQVSESKRDNISHVAFEWSNKIGHRTPILSLPLPPPPPC